MRAFHVDHISKLVMHRGRAHPRADLPPALVEHDLLAKLEAHQLLGEPAARVQSALNNHFLDLGKDFSGNIPEPKSTSTVRTSPPRRDSACIDRPHSALSACRGGRSGAVLPPVRRSISIRRRANRSRRSPHPTRRPRLLTAAELQALLERLAEAEKEKRAIRREAQRVRGTSVEQDW